MGLISIQGKITNLLLVPDCPSIGNIKIFCKILTQDIKLSGRVVLFGPLWPSNMILAFLAHFLTN